MAKTAKRGRPRKAKQQWIPGTEPPSLPALDDAADNYFEVMQERCKLSKAEDETKTALIELMREHGMDRYETPDGLVVTVTARSNCKVKRKQDAESNGDGE